MRSVNSTYKTLRALIDDGRMGAGRYETRIRVGSDTYGRDKLISTKVYTSLIGDGNGVVVGQACASECELVLLEESENWARMQKFTLDVRVTVDNTSSSWITIGSFYTDTRSRDEYGRLQLVAYDAMLLTEQSWTDKIPEQLLPASYPITARAWATMIQQAGLATFADLTQLDDTVAFVGLDTTSTIRDVLKTIAAAHAGNWVITPNETLKLIQLTNLDIETATADQYVNLNTAVENLSLSPVFSAVTGVQLVTEDGAVAESGSNTGYVLKAACNFSSSTGLAELCLSRINGYIYKPFTATNAVLDPIAEVGDQVAIDGIMYQVMSINWDFNDYPYADALAPYDQEIDHEYTILSQDAKNYRKTMGKVDEKLEDYVAYDEFATAIIQNEQTINLVASHTFVTQNEFDEEIAAIQNQLDGNIQSWSGNVVPTLNNAPAVDWTTSAQKAEHVGDMYFINSDAGIPEAGQYYRFEENNGVYSWQLITDSAITEALAQAAAALAAAEQAQDDAEAASEEAQLRGRIFVVQPTPPYSVGDLWFNDDQSVIKVCTTARETGSFVATDWVKRDKYTDDSAFLAFQTAYNETISAIQDQLDKKAETYYQAEDPSLGWVVHPVGIAVAGIDVVGIPHEIALGHTGDLWYKTTDGTTWYWDGEKWEQQDVPDEVFDKIDGKAQIFVTTPYPPYNVGDLWFNSASSDILTCMTARTSGNYVEGDFVKRNKYTDDSSLTSFINATYTPAIAAIQADLDGKVDTYFYAYEPTLSNVPASQWNTTALKDSHVDDLFYNTANGYTYRFTKNGSNYAWTRVKDSDITSAMQAASNAQDTADGKRRVFVAQPTNAQSYDVGDLWVNATYGSTYSNDLLRCKTAKAAGESFNISHWEKASKYTDDSSLTTFISNIYTPEMEAVQADIDGKIETYFYAYTPTLQNVPASEWTTDEIKDEHVDDLFFDTVSGYTYRFKKTNGVYSWERIKDSDITSAMSAASAAQDTADGKRRVFVAQPTKAQAYDVGDLWVNATYGTTYSNDLLRCKTAKAAGATFKISHWEKASKYTDDSAADAVSQELTQFESRFSVEPEQIDAEISKRVIKDHTETKTTFGWEMTDTYHKWYANNQEIARIQQSGLFVKGEIRATSGYIGNDSNGFEINATNIHNGMTSLADTQHNGVYVGTDGIALGQGRFKVTSSGSVTASDLNITGGSIKLGGTSANPVFQVTSGGAVTASNMSILGGSITIKDSQNNVIFSANSSGVTVNGNGTFTGTVYAKNIQVGENEGYITGTQIGSGQVDTANLKINAVTNDILSSNSVSNSKLQLQAVDSGNIVQNCLSDTQMAINSLTTDALSLGIGESLGLADLFGLATQASATTYPSNFTAGRINSFAGFYGGSYKVQEQGEVVYDLTSHYHTVTVSQDGTVQFGLPTPTRPDPFNVADTKKYKDDVAAIEVKSLDIEYTYDDEMHIYRLVGKAKNQAGTVVYQSTAGQWNTDRSAYVDGKADGADEVTVTSITRTYPDGETSYPYYDSPTLGKIIEFKAIATMSNSHSGTEILTVPADAAYNAGYEAGSQGGSGSVTVTSLGFDPNDPVSYSATVNNYYVPIKAVLSNTVTRSTTLTVPATEAYNAGETAGVASVTVTTISRKREDVYVESSHNTFVYVQAEASNGAKKDNIIFTVSGANAYNAGVSDGEAGVSVTAMQYYTVSGEQTISYDSATNTLTASVQATLSNGNTNGSIRSVSFPANLAYNAGEAAGVASVMCSTLGFDPDESVSYSSTVNNYYVPIKAVLTNGYFRRATLTISGQEAYNQGQSSVTAEAQSMTTSSSDYGTYDQSIGYGSSSLYTVSGSQYGRIKIKLSNNVERVVRISMPAGSSASVSSITVSSHSNTESDIIWGDNEDFFLRTNVAAYTSGSSTPIFSDTTGDVLCDISTAAYYFWDLGYPDHSAALDTDSSNYGTYDVSLNMGLTGKSYVSGSQRYGRVGIYNNRNSLLKTVRVYMPSSGTSGVQISAVEGLTTDSTNYREYDFPASFYSGSVYTYGSNQYSRVRVTLSNNVQQVIRVATPASGSGGSITITRGEYPAGTYYNENGYTIKYYKYNSSGGFVKADAVCGSASNSGDIDVTDLVQAFYNMGRSAGGGGSYTYDWSEEKSGPYGSKQRDCYFRVNGSIVQTAKVIWSSGNPSFQ